MNSDNTVFNNAPIIEGASESTNIDATCFEGAAPAAEAKSMGTPCKVILGAAGGILLGTVGAFAAHRAFSSDEAEGVSDDMFANKGAASENAANNEELANGVASANDENADSAENTAPNFDVTSVEIAQGNYDDLTFDEALEAARAEVGPGNVFEWNGGYYATFSNEEWAQLSAEERDTFTDNFSSLLAENGDAPAEEVPEAEEPVEEKPIAEEPVAEEAPAEAEGAPAAGHFDLSMASSVNDSMSFNEAFAAARAEVGAGGVFQWHGNYYNTYYAEEWNSMTPGEHAQFQDDFAHLDLPSNPHHTPEAPEVADNTLSLDGGEVIAVDRIDGVDVALVLKDDTYYLLIDTDGDGIYDIATTDVNGDDDISDNEIFDISGENLSVDYLADLNSSVVEETEDSVNIYHTNVNGSEVNIAEISEDGKDYQLVDLDNDRVFDAMLYDENGDGEITPDEVLDIRDYELSVNDLGGFTNEDDNYALTPDNDEAYNDDSFDSSYYESTDGSFDVDTTTSEDFDPNLI